MITGLSLKKSGLRSRRRSARTPPLRQRYCHDGSQDRAESCKAVRRVGHEPSQDERAADEQPQDGGVEQSVDGEAGPDGAKGVRAPFDPDGRFRAVLLSQCSARAAPTMTFLGKLNSQGVSWIGPLDGSSTDEAARLGARQPPTSRRVSSCGQTLSEARPPCGEQQE